MGLIIQVLNLKSWHIYGFLFYDVAVRSWGILGYLQGLSILDGDGEDEVKSCTNCLV